MDVDSRRLGRMLDMAQTDLQIAAGGSPLCKVSITGIRSQSVKYFEGRWAALRVVQRGADPQTTLDAWRTEYQRHQNIGSGDAWLQYSAGGVDALFELLD